MYAAGILLAIAIAIVTYYRALELGPVSVVTPIFGTFLVLSSIIGIAFLDEPFTLRKGGHRARRRRNLAGVWLTRSVMPSALVDGAGQSVSVSLSNSPCTSKMVTSWGSSSSLKLNAARFLDSLAYLSFVCG